MDGERRRSSMYDGDREDAPRDGRRSRWVLVGAGLAVVAIAGGAVVVLLAARNDEAPREAGPDESVPATDPPDDAPPAGVIERVTAEGLTVRLSMGDDLGMMGFPQPAVDGAPDWCEVSGMAFGTIISEKAVAQSQLALSKVAGPEGGGQVMLGGTMEGAPIWGAVVQVPPQITLVRATYPGREPDEMEPVDGVAVVALTAPPLPAGQNVAGPFGFGIDLRQAAIEFVAGNGGRTTLDVQTDLMGPPMWNDQRCWDPTGNAGGTIPPSEPPSLPDPGEQPADAEAAEAAVRAALGDLFDAPIEEGREFFALLDDASGIDLGVASAMKTATDLKTLLTEGDATITDLVFISPIEAFFFYDLDAPMGPVTYRFGRARVVDGVWKITRGTFCQEVLNYGVFCGV